MPFSRFAAHSPILLYTPDSSSTKTTTSSKDDQQILTTEEITSCTWHMIASSSSMWQDRKHSLTLKYSPSTSHDEFHDQTTWYAEGTNKQSSTRGTAKSIPGESGYVYHWRGAGWLRWVSIKWEIVGFGVWRLEEGGEGKSEGEGVVVFVQFVPKTMFSPQSVSVFLQERLDAEREERILEGIVKELRSLDSEALSAEMERFKVIPRS